MKRKIIRFLLGILILHLFYFLAAILFSIIPVNTNHKPQNEGIEIMLISNGIHIDFLVPAQSEWQDWREKIALYHFPGISPNYQYIAFGWGDKTFYLETPTWEDLTLSNALKSVYIPTESVMHVTYYYRMPQETELRKSLFLTEEQYKVLVEYIAQSFELDDDGNFKLNPSKGYGNHDRFYEAKGNYYFLNTCNYWVNRGLKKIGVRTALWSPFDKGIFFHL